MYEDKIYIINVRCPSPKIAVKMINEIEKTKKNKDSIGGKITCIAKNVPAGLGEPCFDKVK